MRKHVRQFHQEKDVVVSEYVLGRFDEAATAQLHEDAGQQFREEASATDAAVRCARAPARLLRRMQMRLLRRMLTRRARLNAMRSYHAHLFANGTACDLTGEPRSTEVRFVCAPEVGAAQAGVATPAHFIESVKEPVTCHYVLTLATPLLCAHDAFRVEEAPVAHIRCRALGNVEAAARAGDGGAGAELGAAVAGARDEL